MPGSLNDKQQLSSSVQLNQSASARKGFIYHQLDFGLISDQKAKLKKSNFGLNFGFGRNKNMMKFKSSSLHFKATMRDLNLIE